MLSSFRSYLKPVLCWTVCDEMFRFSAVGTVDAWSLRIGVQCARAQNTDLFLEEVNLGIVKCAFSPLTTCSSKLQGQLECIVMSGCLSMQV